MRYLNLIFSLCILSCASNPSREPSGNFGDEDRRLESAWVRQTGRTLAEVKDRYAATGVLRCGEYILNANLVLTNDLIVTSAHGFLNEKNCAVRAQAQNCTVTFRPNGREQVVKIAELIKQGFVCPGVPKNTDDWAVLRLTRNISGIKPYQITGKEELANQKVTAVSAVNTEWSVGGRLYPDETKSIGDCRTDKVFRARGVPIFVMSDCDGGEGHSGRALLSDGGMDPVLMAINQGTSETPEMWARSRANRVTNSAPFSNTTWWNGEVPLRGAFLQAVFNAAGLPIPN